VVEHVSREAEQFLIDVIKLIVFVGVHVLSKVFCEFTVLVEKINGLRPLSVRVFEKLQRLPVTEVIVIVEREEREIKFAAKGVMLAQVLKAS